MIVDLNVLVYAFKFYMTTDIILIVMMHVMCKILLELLGKDNCQ
jgi:hypothetical protein